MIKNIILTGERHIGKTTIINEVIQQIGREIEVAGFRTILLPQPDTFKSFFIEPIQLEKQHKKKKRMLIGRSLRGEKCFGITENFEGFGKTLLETSLVSDAEIVVLDELGFLEGYAEEFQKKVFELLDSKKIVLGVIKPLGIPFLEAIRKRKDVMIYVVTASNRDLLTQEIIQQVQFILDKNNRSKKSNGGMGFSEKTKKHDKGVISYTGDQSDTDSMHQ